MNRKTSFWHNQAGAAAAAYALALPALVAVAGIGFDYARLAAMDTELQNAADQAALAGATQLDKQPGAIARATTAAQGGLVANVTRFSNDGQSGTVDVPTVTFYTTAAAAETCDGGAIDPSDAGADAEAAFICVSVETRTANYALTPVVGAFRGSLDAQAVAGVGTAICKVPPVMMCNPAEPLGNTDPAFDFDADALAGAGLKLITGNASAPGNFGFLETGYGSGAQNLARALGYNAPPGDCMPIDGVTTKPGMNAVVMAAINTRFDISENGENTCPSGGDCSPSRNVRKDLVRGSQCGITGNGWEQSPNPYRPTTAAALTSGYPDIMGHPRDLCHAFSNDLSASTAAGCTLGDGRIGNGQWDRNAYFLVNYGWDSSTWPAKTGLGANASRYDVYTWELENLATSDREQNVSASRTGYSYPVCRAPGIMPGGDNVDRRRISAAVVNCEAQNLNGSETGVGVLKWVDLFLVEPSVQRRRGSTVITEATDVYFELIGETGTGAAGSTAGQVVRRDMPYLLK